MPDIVLRIHSKGQDPHEITAPDDLVTEEFLTELVKGLRLPQSDEKGLPIVWEADDKDNGQLLAPGRSLAANGVRAGHNIYLRQKAVSPPVVPPPITKPTPPPTPPGPSKWPLWLSLLLIPVAGVAGFYTGSAQEFRLGPSYKATRPKSKPPGSRLPLPKLVPPSSGSSSIRFSMIRLTKTPLLTN